MQFEFNAESEPLETLYKELTDFAPTNPFYTTSYMKSKSLLGFKPWVLSLRKNGKMVSICTAFMKSDFLFHSLQIESLPSISDESSFWDGLYQFCKQNRILHLSIQSSASDGVHIPSQSGEIARTSRNEYVLNLNGTDLWKQINSHHRRQVKRAHKAGLKVICTKGEQAWNDHIRVVKASFDRRKARGENVIDVNQARLFNAIIKSGAGELFQSALDDKVLSSILVLTAAKGAYYYWAGSSKEGMACGSSHFLIYEIAKIMQNRSMVIFNLGGSDPLNNGLIDFKLRFGSEEVALESAEFIQGSRFKWRIAKAVGLIKENPAIFFKRLRNKLK